MHLIEDNFFNITWLHFIGNPHHVNIIMDFGKTSFKAQKSPYLHKKALKPIVQAHGTSSYFWLMIQAHESHRGNFRSCGLEGQEVCSVKL